MSTLWIIVPLITVALVLFVGAIFFEIKNFFPDFGKSRAKKVEEKLEDLETKLASIKKDRDAQLLLNQWEELDYQGDVKYYNSQLFLLTFNEEEGSMIWFTKDEFVRLMAYLSAAERY